MRRRTMRLATFVALGAAVTLAACGNSYGTGGSGCTPTTTQVCAVDKQFIPANLTIMVGTTVTWENGGGVAQLGSRDTGGAFENQLSPRGDGTPPVEHNR